MPVMSSKVHVFQNDSSNEKNSFATPRRAVPLSTRQILLAILILSAFSFVYLVYAQHHTILFYTMTGIVAVYIVFVYTSGIAAVLYMVIRDYEIDENSENPRRRIEESVM